MSAAADDALHGPRRRVEGPWVWALSLLVGLGIGAALAKALPATYGALASAPGAMIPTIPLILCVPFAVLLGCIALMPFVNAHLWHHHFPDVSFFLGGLVAAYYLVAFNAPGFSHGMTYGQSSVLHAVAEYYSFIALVGGLFVVSGTILIELRGRATPAFNTGLLLLGAVLANVVGTTGASMLLVRPFIRANEGRLRPIHVVMFIFIVSNCGGALTPIGDPPLYLGYLKGVPFAWTIENLAGEWAFVVGLLLVIFYGIDRTLAAKSRGESWPSALTGNEPDRGPYSPTALGTRLESSRTPRGTGGDATPMGFGLSIRGSVGVACLVLMVAGVFIDPAVKHFAAGVPALQGYPVGATFQLAVAAFAFLRAPRAILDANQFSFFPVKEVGLLFLGIFLTMVPALGYLSANGSKLGVDSPTTFYFATGALSAILDNAPTYLNFMQIAFGDREITATTVRQWLTTREHVLDLRAISTAAVFFGAMTYIGNGPNFMVKSIAEASLIKMPSFFGYLGLALVILLPVLVANWALFFVVLR